MQLRTSNLEAYSSAWKKRSWLLHIPLLFGFYFTSAQDLSTNLSWTVDRLVDMKTAESFDYSCSFITNGTRDITWLQRGATVTSTLNTQSVNGSWADASASGQLTYSISANGKNGTLKFERTDVGVFITIDLTQSDSTGIKHQYHVTSIQTN